MSQGTDHGRGNLVVFLGGGRGGEAVLVYCPVGLADFLGSGGGHEADDPSGGLGVVILDGAEELQVEVLHEGEGDQVLA